MTTNEFGLIGKPSMWKVLVIGLFMLISGAGCDSSWGQSVMNSTTPVSPPSSLPSAVIRLSDIAATNSSPPNWNTSCEETFGRLTARVDGNVVTCGPCMPGLIEEEPVQVVGVVSENATDGVCRKIINQSTNADGGTVREARHDILPMLLTFGLLSFVATVALVAFKLKHQMRYNQQPMALAAVHAASMSQRKKHPGMREGIKDGPANNAGYSSSEEEDDDILYDIQVYGTSTDGRKQPPIIFDASTIRSHHHHHSQPPARAVVTTVNG